MEHLVGVETNLKYLLGNYLAICEGPVPEEVSLFYVINVKYIYIYYRM